MSLFYQKILLKKSYKFITSSSQKHYYLPIFVKFAILSVTPNSFSTLYQNLVKETNDLLKQAKEITKINDKDFSNLNEKIEHLTEFVEINEQ